MVFEILSRENCQPKVLLVSIGKLIFQKSANPANVLVIVLLSCYISVPQILRLQGRPENTRHEWDGKTVRFSHTCISKEQSSMETPK